MWAILASSIPLVASMAMIALLFSYPVLSWLPTSLQDEIEINFSGELRVGDDDFVFHQVDFLYRHLFLIIRGQGARWLLWRDSCDESDYRQLLVKLKREQYRSH
ncbi:MULTISPECIES: hypothetical protein [unclassified Vibrio]|uniref:hypothetical protein n=1 Tax=unclassified Vibrio TaxID=2614977 RepID=UPI000C165587|nr:MULTISPECIES: hypothetical protein [unclassified Vibrio]NAX35718.1 hypothetical protein [Vibrio sp. V29_P1S30P107]NAW69058.1 hypothetical protein [Vibrio sp. V28_P6S34P95]NAX04313.1 hypothetical protein [Vibrio sp. V30_P3S12P165]NAX40894.1 hypothetical protein [Vibrio sp. V26_P1S5P106]NNN73658.1 hypothetical protein [Vibrio sp. 12-2(3-a)]